MQGTAPWRAKPTAMAKSDERRRHPRVFVGGELKAGPRDATFSIRLLDISESGVRFTCEQELMVNNAISFTIDFYPVHFPIQGMLKWRKHRDYEGRFEYGCEFINLDKEEAYLIREHVRDVLKQPR